MSGLSHIKIRPGLFLVLLSFISLLFSIALSCSDSDDDDSDDDNLGDDDDTDDDDNNDFDDDGYVDDDDDDPCFDQGETLEPDPPGRLVYAAQHGNFIFFYSPGALESIPSSLQTQLGEFSAIQVAGIGAEHGEQSAVMAPDNLDLSPLEGVVFAGIKPRLQLDENGHFHLIYIDHLNGRLMYAHNSSGAFSREVIEGGFSENDWLMFFAISPAGSPHVLHYDPTNAHLDYFERTSKGWSRETLHTGALSSRKDFHMAIDDQNVAHVVFTRHNKTALVLSDNESGQHVPTELSFSTLPQAQTPVFRSPQIALGAGGETIVSFVYGDEADHQGALYLARKPQGEWNLSTVEDGLSLSKSNARMVLDSGSEPVFLLLRSTDYFVVRKSGGLWSADPVLDCSDWDRPSQLLLHPSDAPHVTYPCQIGHYSDTSMEVRQRYLEQEQWKTALAAPGGPSLQEYELRMVHSAEKGFFVLSLDLEQSLIVSSDAGGFWESEILYMANSTENQVALARDENGDPIVVLHDAGTIRYFSKSAGPWEQTQSWDKDENNVRAVDLVVHADSHPHILYYRDSDDSIWQLAHDGATWTDEKIVEAPSAWLIRAGYNATGHLHIFYRDLGGLNHAHQKDGLWQTERISWGDYHAIDVVFLPGGDMVAAGGGMNDLCVVAGQGGAWNETCDSIRTHGLGLILSSANKPLVGVSFNQARLSILDVSASTWAEERITDAGATVTDLALSDSGEVCQGAIQRGALMIFCADEGDLF